MQKIHTKLTQKYPAYHNWHQAKHCNKIHWGVLVVYSFVVFSFILNPLEINFFSNNNSSNSNLKLKQAQAINPIDALQPGEWYEVPNSKIRDVTPTDMYADYQIGRFSSIIDAWNSGAYDIKRDRYIITGGGHNDYGGNELYAFDINTLKWSRVWGPSPNIPAPVSSSCLETYDDGNPRSRHTYDGLEYLPNVDRFWMNVGSLYCTTGGSGKATWFFDFNALQWTRKSDLPYNSELEMVSAYDPLTGHLFVVGTMSWQALLEYDPVLDVWTKRGDLSIDVNQTATVDTKRKKFVSIGSGRVFTFDLKPTGTLTRQTLTTTGATDIVNVQFPGVEYDSVSDKIVAWHGGGDVYTLDMDTLVWTKHTTMSIKVPSAGLNNGTYNRWRYVPSKNVFIIANSVDENVFIYKLSSDRTPAGEQKINVTPGMFYALDYPDPPPVGIQNSKHVTWAHNPINGRLYSMGGDMNAGTYPPDAFSSYRQDMYSLSIAERWANRSQRNAGWRQEFPYCMPTTQGIMPKSPDFVGWTWDNTRKVFWMVPGTMVTPGSETCPGRTVVRGQDDPQYKVGHLMTYNPFEPDLAKRWKDWGPLTRTFIFGEDWMSVYDAKTDTIIHFSNNETVDIYDPKTNSWVSMRHASNALGGTVRIYGAALSPDFENRVIYAVDEIAGRLMRWNMDTRTLSDLGPVPDGGVILSINSSFSAWDSVNKVLFFFHPTTYRLHVYHPDTQVWETPAIITDPPGLTPKVNHAIVFDPYQNVLAFLGNRDDAMPYDFIYRYGNGSGTPPPTQDTISPMIPTNLTATPISSSQINLSWTASTDNVGVTGYKIYRCAGSACAPTTQIATSATNSYPSAGLTAFTAYTYAVSAFDAAGNESGKSIAISAITPVFSTGNIINANPSNYLSLISTLKAGDTLLLELGTYSANGLPVYNLNGTPDQRIIIKGPDAGPRPIILGSAGQNTVRIRNSSHVIIKNLEIDGRNLGGDPVNGESTSHHITLENLYIHGFSDDQGTVGISTNRATTWNWTIRNNIITDGGTGMYLGNSPGTEPFIGGLIEGNLIYDTIGYNTEIKHQLPRPTNIPGMPTTPQKTIIRHNVFSKANNASIGGMARPNLLVGHFPLSGSGQDDRYEIYGNFFYQNPTGEPLFQGEGNIGLYNNLFFNSVAPAGGYAAVHIAPHNDKPRDIRVFHNTIVTKDKGLSVSGGYPEFQQKVIGNAVFAATPISTADQQDNITDTYDNAGNYLKSPFAPLGTFDLYPLANKLTGIALDSASFNTYTDWSKDFNGDDHTHTFRGAYTKAGQNSGWLPKVERKPITSESVPRDTTSPTLTSVTAPASTTVILTFSEPLDQLSVTTLANYAINNNITTSNASLGQDQKTVTLTTSPHEQNITYTLTVNNIKDRAPLPNTILSNTQKTYTLVTQVLITNLTAVSGKLYEAATNLQSGSLTYIDRAYTYTTIPAWLLGATYIKTANDDKASTGASFLSFTINQDATVYVAHDNVIATKPSWLSSFTDTGQDIIGHTTFSLFKKDFPQGQVTLGGNEGGGDSMYAVIIQSKGTQTTYKPSDLNKDTKVDQLDFNILKQDFNRTDKPLSDINQDGIVDSRDLGIMMGEWSR